MISVSTIPGILLDLRYATNNNFMKKNMYPVDTYQTYLRKVVITALLKVVQDLKKQGLTLVIFDAYRPYYVTEDFWKIVRDDRYAANPAKGSGHNRGIAIDVSLANLKTSQPLNMPTDFDNFSDSAHQDFMEAESLQIRNRKILKDEMTKFGFIPLSTEWWHYSWPGEKNFEVLNLSFEQLQ
jgi:zinc D-Ala-D-Ala dipeptidase